MFSYLTAQQVNSLTDALLATGLNTADTRNALLEGIDPGFVASLPVNSANVLDQMRSDINVMNRVPHLESGEVPLQIWLENGTRRLQRGGQLERRFFQEMLDNVTAKSPQIIHDHTETKSDYGKEVQTRIAERVIESVKKLMLAVQFVERENASLSPSQGDYDSAYTEWEVSRATLSSEIRVFFVDPQLSDDWNEFSDGVTQLYVLSGTYSEPYRGNVIVQLQRFFPSANLKWEVLRDRGEKRKSKETFQEYYSEWRNLRGTIYEASGEFAKRLRKAKLDNVSEVGIRFANRVIESVLNFVLAVQLAERNAKSLSRDDYHAAYKEWELSRADLSGEILIRFEDPQLSAEWDEFSEGVTQLYILSGTYSEPHRGNVIVQLQSFFPSANIQWEILRDHENKWKSNELFQVYFSEWWNLRGAIIEGSGEFAKQLLNAQVSF